MHVSDALDFNQLRLGFLRNHQRLVNAGVVQWDPNPGSTAGRLEDRDLQTGLCEMPHVER